MKRAWEVYATAHLMLSAVGVLTCSVAGVANAQRISAEVLFPGTVRPAVLASAEVRKVLGSVTLPEPGQLVRVHTRPWELTASLGAGIAFAQPEYTGLAPTVAADVGLLHRVASERVTRVGVLLFAEAHPNLLGPVARVDVANVASVGVGWVWRRRGGNGLLVSLDVVAAFLGDVANE
jgi:hypothetical protein